MIIKKIFRKIIGVKNKTGKLVLVKLSSIRALYLISMALLITILSLTFISADGCCFNSNDGRCSAYSDESACRAIPGGEFYNSPGCSISKCVMGCCMLGVNSRSTTAGQCELLSRQLGFEYSWSAGLIGDRCVSVLEGQERGACLFGDYMPYSCKYVMQSECGSGNFYPGSFCTDSRLNTTCNSTGNTFCYDDDVYGRDSCGNPDGKKQDCNSQSICTRKNSQEAYCRSLNCADSGLDNGESECVNEDPLRVGTRFFRRYCINGNTTVEPCADFRMETCSTGDEGGEAKCEINPWANCLAAGNDSEECDPDYCYMYGAEGAFSSIPRFPICVPLVAGGQQFYESEETGTNTEALEEICAKGNYEIGSAGGPVTEQIQLHMNTETAGSESFTFPICYGLGAEICRKLIEQRPLASNVIQTKLEFAEALRGRCRALGDCDGKINYIEMPPAEDIKADEQWKWSIYSGHCTLYYWKYLILEPYSTLSGVKSQWYNPSNYDEYIKHERKTCDFWFKIEFECEPWIAPEGDNDCEKCGEDDLPCSEYRCKSLGEGCEYSEPEGADKGYCTKSSDHAPPSISLKNMNPSSPIPPYTPVTITIGTDEASMCKFDINEDHGKYSEMEYNFGSGFATTHTIKLNLPGQIAGINDEDLANYPLITRDGKYTLNVRCIDPAGNGEVSSPLKILFEVMQYPDTDAPILSNFVPASGSSIKFNTTSKTISFKLNEPAECRWSFEDKSFSQSENNLSCDTSVSNDPLEEYGCSGTLTNVTLNLSEQTRFYIKCKDQPWFENDTIYRHNVAYSRNEHDSLTDYEYVLKPSAEFLITELSPIGSIKRPGSNVSVQLFAATYGGASNGRSTCYWRQSNETWPEGSFYTKFFSTNSNMHSHILTPPIGTNYIQIKCNDSAENEAKMNATFDLAIDAESPTILRLYEKLSQLRIKTDEESLCYISFNKTLGCSFNFENATLMSGTEKEHTASWLDDATYFIRCRDYNENENSGCGKIIRAY